MLRGPEDGGAGGLLQAHMAAWICMSPRYSRARSSSDGEQRSGVPPAGRLVLLPGSGGRGGGPARRGFVAAFAGSCHIQPVSGGPGEMEIHHDGAAGTAWGRHRSRRHGVWHPRICACHRRRRPLRRPAWAGVTVYTAWTQTLPTSYFLNCFEGNFYSSAFCFLWFLIFKRCPEEESCIWGALK